MSSKKTDRSNDQNTNKQSTSQDNASSKDENKKPDSTSSDNNQKQGGATSSRIDIAKVVGALKKNNPDKVPALNKTYNELQKVRKKIEQNDEQIKLISQILDPKEGEEGFVSVDDRKKISGADKAILRKQKKDLRSENSRLNKKKKKLEKEIKEKSNKDIKDTSIFDLRERVKDPLYYKKYGKDIPKAISRFFEKPMDEKVYEQLKELMKYAKTKTAEAVADFSDSFGRFLLWADPYLYFRCTGNSEARAKYFMEFREKLKSWNPAKAKLKASKTETTKKTANNPAKKTQSKKKNGKKQPVKKTRKKQAAK